MTRRRGAPPGSTFSTVRELARALPGTEEGTCYGTPALRVRGKLFARLKEDGATLVLRVDADNREALMRAAPDAFFITDHYRDHPWVLVRLAALERSRLAELLEDAWRRAAPRPLVRALDARRGRA